MLYILINLFQLQEVNFTANPLYSIVSYKLKAVKITTVEVEEERGEISHDSYNADKN